MAQTVVSTAVGPGAGATRPVLFGGPRVGKIRHYLIDFSTSNYVVGGEDISNIFDDFVEVLHICVQQKDTNTAADRREVAVDYSAQTVLLYDAFNTEETASDQGVVTLSFLVFGL